MAGWKRHDSCHVLQAAEHWEKALAINPLNAEGWFALGHCLMKCSSPTEVPPPAASPPSAAANEPQNTCEQTHDEEEEPDSTASASAEPAGIQRAMQAFTRTVQQAPDHAQAWNNLAALHMQVPPPLLHLQACSAVSLRVTPCSTLLMAVQARLWKADIQGSGCKSGWRWHSRGRRAVHNFGTWLPATPGPGSIAASLCRQALVASASTPNQSLSRLLNSWTGWDHLSHRLVLVPHLLWCSLCPRLPILRTRPFKRLSQPSHKICAAMTWPPCTCAQPAPDPVLRMQARRWDQAFSVLQETVTAQ